MATAAATVASEGGAHHGGAVDSRGFDMTPVDDEELDRLRHRNVSGSLSSHDYEEMSTSSASLRSTPTYEQRSHCHHSYLATHQQLVHSPRTALDFDGNRVVPVDF